jgi:hypothetical protein
MIDLISELKSDPFSFIDAWCTGPLYVTANSTHLGTNVKIILIRRLWHLVRSLDDIMLITLNGFFFGTYMKCESRPKKIGCWIIIYIYIFIETSGKNNESLSYILI